MSKRSLSNSPSTIRTPKKSKAAPPEVATHILDLNDDCLDVVFMHMDPIDLGAVKETCRRFTPVANDAFRRKFRHEIFEFSAEYPGTSQPGGYKLSPKLLRTFGEYVHGLIVSYIEEERHLKYWEFIRDQCTQLKQLKFSSCNFALFQPMSESMVRRKLDNLHFESCFGDDKHFTQIIDHFANFNILTVAWCPWLRGAFLRQHFPRLQNFRIHGNDEMMTQNFNEFVQLNPQIENIITNDYAIYESLNLIVKNCPNIDSLGIRHNNEQMPAENIVSNISCLSHLDRLKKLELYCDQRPITSAIETFAVKNSLESLCLDEGKFDMNLCRALCKLTNLKTLKLIYTSGITSDLLKKLGSEMNLENLQLLKCDEVKYDDIPAVIKHSRSLQLVVFQIDSELRDERFGASQLLLLANARKESQAGFPLDFVLRQSPSDDKISVGDPPIKDIDDFIKLKVSYPQHWFESLAFDPYD